MNSVPTSSGAVGADERAALRDVLRVVGEERVEALVLDAQRDGARSLAALLQSSVAFRHRRAGYLIDCFSMWNVLTRAAPAEESPSACGADGRARQPAERHDVGAHHAGHRASSCASSRAARRTRRSSTASTRENTPSKPALIWRGRTTTWAELDERIDRLAAGLVRRGIGRKTEHHAHDAQPPGVRGARRRRQRARAPRP